jgi:hypothetical protein
MASKKPPGKVDHMAKPGVSDILHSLLKIPPTSSFSKSGQDQLDKTTQGEKLFRSTFGTIMFAQRWQKVMSADKRAKIVEMFTNPRDDPNDVYKPNSRIETQTTIEIPASKPLSKDTGDLLHEIAANYDFCVPLDIIESYRPETFISEDCQEEIDRLPSWLRFLVIFKYDAIHAAYGHRSHQFLKNLANQVDIKRISSFEEFEGQNEDDVRDTFEIYNRFRLNDTDTEISRIANERRKTDFRRSDLYKLKLASMKRSSKLILLLQ